MTAGASLLDLIGERTSSERAPAVRAIGEGVRRRRTPGGAVGARGPRAFTPTLDEHGYEAPGSVVETNTEDWPFLVDSVSAALRSRGLGMHRVLHPIVGVERDADGAIEAVLHPREASSRRTSCSATFAGIAKAI